MIIKHGLWFFKRLKTGSNFVSTSGDILVNSGGISVAGALSAGGTATFGGDFLVGGHVDGTVRHFNAFQYPAPGTDFTPGITGAALALNKSTKKVWLPFTGLKHGEEIVSYRLVGHSINYSGKTDTVDAKLVKVNLAAPVTTTDVASGSIVQVTVSTAIYALATLNTPETVASGKQYGLEIEGSASVSGAQVIMGADAVINTKV